MGGGKQGDSRKKKEVERLAEERENSRRVRDRLMKKGEKGIQIERGGAQAGEERVQWKGWPIDWLG